MKAIKEVYPEFAKEEQKKGSFYGPCDYAPLLESFGYEILLQVDDSDYQGDSRLIYRDSDRYGLLIFGWGSCSGCDALQACHNMKEISDLRDELHGQIKWDTLIGLRDYISGKDWELDYCWHADETKDFINKALALLGGMLEEQSQFN